MKELKKFNVMVELYDVLALDEDDAIDRVRWIVPKWPGDTPEFSAEEAY